MLHRSHLPPRPSARTPTRWVLAALVGASAAAAVVIGVGACDGKKLDVSAVPDRAAATLPIQLAAKGNDSPSQATPSHATPSKAASLTATDGSPQAPANAGGPEVTRQCKALVLIINESVTKMDRGAKGGRASSDLAQLASDMQDMVVRLGRVDLQDAKLDAFAARYKAMASRISRSAKSLASAVDGFDPRGMQRAEERFAAALALEGPLVAELNHYCQIRRH